MEEYIKIIDAHSHLWLRQEAEVAGKQITPPPDGRSLFMGDEVHMLPPFMIDGTNSAEVFLSNMNYARVSAAVVTQEFIDGLQNDYLLEVGRRYPQRFFVFGMCEFRQPGFLEEGIRLMDAGFRGIKIPAARLLLPEGRVRLDSVEMMTLFARMEERGVILGIELADGDCQVEEMETIISAYPKLKIIIGHFGMVTRPNWLSQIRLARHPNVYVESGGITWLFNDEFYPFPSAVRAIREAADLVGMDKLMWGSDYPRTITAITYKMSYDFLFRSKLLSAEELSAFLSENARKFFGFNQLVSLPYIKNMSE